MKSNKITAVRLANLAQQRDPALDSFIDYENLKIHFEPVSDDVDSKRKYFKNLYAGAKMKIIQVIEEGLKIFFQYVVINGAKSTLYFDVYKFNESGKLIELWTHSQPPTWSFGLN